MKDDTCSYCHSGFIAIESACPACGRVSRKPYETDDELRARILGTLSHAVPIASVDHLDYVVSDALHEHMPLAIGEDNAKEALVAHWLRGWLRALPWWKRLTFWWRLWRATRPGRRHG